jgi:O-antigen ligase
MAGAMAMAASEGRRSLPKALFFLLVLAASYVAIRNNCSRIAMICAPLLVIVMLAANFGKLKNIVGLALALAFLAGMLLMASDSVTLKRFKDMAANRDISVNNAERLNYWRQGLDVFMEHPILGIGPAAKPNLPPELNVNRRPSPYAHAHNVYLTFMAENGLVGLAAFLFFIFCPLRLLWPSLSSQDPLAFFWSWAALAVSLQLAMNGVTDHVYGNKIIMYLHFSVMGAALWMAMGRWPENQGRPGEMIANSYK